MCKLTRIEKQKKNEKEIKRHEHFWGKRLEVVRPNLCYSSRPKQKKFLGGWIKKLKRKTIHSFFFTHYSCFVDLV